MDEAELSRLTVGALLDRQADRFADLACVAFPDRDVRFTYGKFRERVDFVARGLMALGVRKAEHVAVWAPNVPEWTLLQFATAKIGAVLVPIASGLRADDVEYVLRHSDATTLFLASGADGRDYVAELHSILPRIDDAPVGHASFENLPRLRRLFFIGRGRLPGMLRFDDLFDVAAQTHPDDYRRRGEALDSFEVINVRYAPGREDRPKGALLTHRNVIVHAWHLTERVLLNESDRVFVAAPFWERVGSDAAHLGSIAHGACTVSLDAFDPRSTLQAISTEGATAIFATPQLYDSLATSPAFASFDLASVRRGLIAANLLSGDAMRATAPRLGVDGVSIAFGLPEAGPAIVQTSLDDSPQRRAGNSGRPLPGMQLQVADAKTGDPLPREKEGELCCRGHGVMKGYHKDAAATAAAIDPEGWFHTGARASIDRDGYVTVSGRVHESASI